MKLSPETIRGFQQACKADHGIEVNDSEAAEEAAELLAFYQLISKHYVQKNS